MAEAEKAERAEYADATAFGDAYFWRMDRAGRIYRSRLQILTYGTSWLDVPDCDWLEYKKGGQVLSEPEQALKGEGK